MPYPSECRTPHIYVIHIVENKNSTYHFFVIQYGYCFLFSLRCHSTVETLNLTVQKFDEGGRGVGAEHRKRGREMLPTVALGWQALALRGEKAGRFREVVGVFNSRQPNKLAIDRVVVWMLALFMRCHSTTETLNLTV